MNKLLHFIFNAFYLNVNLAKVQCSEYDLTVLKENTILKTVTCLFSLMSKVFSKYRFKLYEQRQSIKQNFSFINILLISVLISYSAKTNAQECITPPTSGNYTFASNTKTCFSVDATFGDVTFQDGSEIYIEPGVTVIIQNNVSSFGNIIMNVEGTLQFNNVTRINANIKINIASTGVLKSGSSGTNDFAIQGNGINTIVNEGLIEFGVLDFNNANGENTVDNIGVMTINNNVNIAGVCHFRNQGTLSIGSSYNCKETTVFVNCGTMTSGSGFNLEGGKVYNSGDFIVAGGNINFGKNTAKFENTGYVDVQNGNLLLGGNGSEYYNEGLTKISNTIQNDGTIKGPDVGTGKLGYMAWGNAAVMNNGSIGPNLNLKNLNGASKQIVMFNNQNLNFVSPLYYDCESSGNCVQPLIKEGEACRAVDGSLSNVITALDDDYSSNPVASGETINTSIISNDALDGQAVILGAGTGKVSITDVAGDTDILTLDINTGLITVTSGATSGTYTLTYTLCENDDPANCDTATVTIVVENVTGVSDYFCKEPVNGNTFSWKYGNDYSYETVSETIIQPGTNAGYQFDIYELDNSFNMEINGVSLAQYEIEFQSDSTPAPGINIEFEDGDQYVVDTPNIWQMVGTTQNPVIRVVIDPSGEVSMYGSKTSGGPLFPLKFKQGISPVNFFNTIPWNENSNNTIIVTQNVVGPTGMNGYGYGQNLISCDTYTLEKDSVFNDENGDGIAQPGETITYTLSVTNLGDIDIYNVTVNDPMLGGEITSAYTGDVNSDGVLNIGEVWEYEIVYTIIQADINSGGIYNQAFVTGETSEGDSFEPEYSVDPTPLDPSDPNYDSGQPDHTFTLLVGRTLLITNPNIYHRVKNN